MNKIIPKLHKINENSTPLCVQINLTNRCVNRCNSCRKYLWQPLDIDYRLLKKIVNELIEMKVETIIFSGGEVLLYRRFLDILKYIKENSNIETSMITSGLSDATINIMEIAKNVNRIYISLDSIDSEIYRKIRGRGDIEIVKSTTILFKKYNVNTKVWITKQRLNEKYIDDVKRWCDDNNIEYNIFPVHTYKDLMIEDDIKVLSKYCMYSYGFCIIDASLEMYSCCKLPHDNDLFEERRQDLCLGNLKDKSFKEIWFSDGALKIKKIIHDARQPECVSCDRGHSVNEYYSYYIENKDKKVFL